MERRGRANGKEGGVGRGGVRMVDGAVEWRVWVGEGGEGPGVDVVEAQEVLGVRGSGGHSLRWLGTVLCMVVVLEEDRVERRLWSGM